MKRETNASGDGCSSSATDECDRSRIRRDRRSRGNVYLGSARQDSWDCPRRSHARAARRPVDGNARLQCVANVLAPLEIASNGESPPNCSRAVRPALGVFRPLSASSNHELPTPCGVDRSSGRNSQVSLRKNNCPKDHGDILPWVRVLAGTEATLNESRCRQSELKVP